MLISIFIACSAVAEETVYGSAYKNPICTITKQSVHKKARSSTVTISS